MGLAQQLEPPSNPPIFTKPADALAGPFQDIHVHRTCQKMLDYEGELAVIIGRDAKNVSESDALDFVLGYAASNDVSCRDLQLPEVCRYMVGYAKSFDGFAPLGPAITSSALLPDPQNIYYTVKVNGELRQQIHTSTMIFNVRRVIAHLSRGTTLRRGTVIMMGTDNGIGWDTNQFLKDGDIVTMEFEGIGTMANKIVFDS
jgi:transcription initiation factor TFIIH subunit 2